MPKNLMASSAGAIGSVTNPLQVITDHATGKESGNMIDSWKEKTAETTRQIENYKQNYDRRDEMTQEGNEYYESLGDEKISKEFTEELKKHYHTFLLDENGKPIDILSGEQNGYKKLIHPVYGYEVVIDENNKSRIITNPVNRGTYNHFSPNDIGGYINHTFFDVMPYFITGTDGNILPTNNANDDPSTIIDRVGRSFYIPKNSKIKPIDNSTLK